MATKTNINIGDVFGKLTVKSINEVENYICDCECGNKNIEKTRNYLVGKVKTKSCGCTSRGNYFAKTNHILKAKDFDNTYYKENNDWIVETYRNNVLYKFIFDDFGIEYLKTLNKHLSVDDRGYCYITMPNIGKQYFIHNLLICGLDYYKDKNRKLIDHINGDATNNKIENLRIADKFDNTQNAKRRKDNTCGIKGFSISIPKNRPLAHIKVAVQGHLERIGHYFIFSPQGLKDAIEWSYNLRLSLHDDFSNFGYDITNKTIEQIIEEQSKVFISNLSEEQIKIFNNDGYIYEPKKFKKQKTFNIYTEGGSLNV
jgi:hypothetical protein